MKLVYLESPYAGRTRKETKRNIDYARKCMADSLVCGESPLASHLLYTQEGILDDADSEERSLGIAAGFAWAEHADLIAVYADLGISGGMKLGIERAKAAGQTIDIRMLSLSSAPRTEEAEDAGPMFFGGDKREEP